MEDAQRVISLTAFVRFVNLPLQTGPLTHASHRAILTVFQVQDAQSDPLTRTAAQCSLVSALMSLSYGITYIIRFGNMRSMYRASRWAEVLSCSVRWIMIKFR
jgi:hypothetical protein